MRRPAIAALCATALLAAGEAGAAGDAKRGALAFRSCVACHSLEPGQNLTGPTLSGLWGRKAGALESFPRYSGPLQRSGIVWNEKTLDAWLRDPATTVPGNYMSFPGIADATARADLIAFLESASRGEAPAAARTQRLPNLRSAPQSARVTAIRYCRNTYFVTNAADQTVPFWEFNLRFKTDAGGTGPAPGEPVLVGQGMQGDRAQIVFSRPEEISRFIREQC